MSAEAEIARKVLELAADEAGVDPLRVTRDSHFFDDLDFDSLQAVEFIMELEDAFELSIPDEESQKILTVGQAIDHIVAHRQAAAAQ